MSDGDLQRVLETDSSAVTSGVPGLTVTSSQEDLKACNVFIITVPTPTDKNKRPVLTPLIKASETVGRLMRNQPATQTAETMKPVVVYESTVYPGVTEDVCVPVLEECSGLVMNEDFFVGYSPERINPGDKERTVTKILKLTSGSTRESAIGIDSLYQSVITAGTHMTPSIKVAEAAKVIENSQRDINIAFVNELAKIFNKLEIDTHAVLEAAATKVELSAIQAGFGGWPLHWRRPILLGSKAQEVGYHPEIILSGRRLNDDMGKYVAGER